MDPISLGALISGGASFLGSIFSSDTSAKNTQAQIQAQEQMQQQTEQFNAGQAQLQRDYQTQMSNTAYQRSRADMEAAGLNPMLMAGMGGASTPSGASASVGTPSVPMPQTTSKWAGIGDAVGKMINSAVTMKTMDKLTEEISNLQAQRELTRAQTATEAEKPAYVAAQTGSVRSDTGLTQQRTQTERAETLKRQDEAAITAFHLPGARFSAKQAEDLEAMPDWLRSSITQGAFVGGKASEAFSPVTDLISSAKGVRQIIDGRWGHW